MKSLIGKSPVCIYLYILLGHKSPSACSDVCCLTDKTVYHKRYDHTDHTGDRDVKLQPESQNNETEIQFHWTAEAEILSVIQKITVEISQYKSSR